VKISQALKALDAGELRNGDVIKWQGVKNSETKQTDGGWLYVVEGGKIIGRQIHGVSTRKQAIEKYRQTEATANLGSRDRAIIAYLLEKGSTYQDAINDCRNNNVTFYEGMTLRDVAQRLVSDGVFGAVNDVLTCYINYDALGDDLGVDYDETSAGVFRRH